MSDGQNLWREDGAPRHPHPACPFCGAAEVGSLFDDAWCHACAWKGTLTTLLEFDLRRRPGRWLLELLEERGLSLGAFGLRIGAGRGDHAALANIRRYTHPSPGADANGRGKDGRPVIKSPSEAMVVRWAEYFGVDVGLFYQPVKE
jgi:hypothetical protein